MGKKWYTLMIVLLLLAGCGKGEKEESPGTQVFYLNDEETQLVGEEYTLKADFKEAMVQEFVEALEREPKKRGSKKLLPPDVELLDYSFGAAGQLILNFNVNYLNLTGIKEILVRAALVETFCQIDGIEYVEFYVNGLPYMNGEVQVGLMRADDFIDQNMDSQTVNVTVYFANQSGDGLLDVQRQVRYNSTISIEQLVLEQLFAGPTQEELQQGFQAVIPEKTKIHKISTKDGVCYLDLSEQFMDHMENVSDEVVIYSIVNSLVELSNINKVQFRINGEIRKNYQSVAFSDMFERNLDLIKSDN